MKKLLKKIDLLLIEVNVFIFVLFDVPKSIGYLQMTVTFSLVIIWDFSFGTTILELFLRSY